MLRVTAKIKYCSMQKKPVTHVKGRCREHLQLSFCYCGLVWSVLVSLCRPKLQGLVKAKGRAHPGGRLFWGGLKDFADGSLGSRTALMQEPYADDSDTKGIRLSPSADLQEIVKQADATGLQVRCELKHH